MATLTTRQRKALPKSAFGLPGSRRYPMPDKSHAVAAKSRAAQQVKKGNLSKILSGEDQRQGQQHHQAEKIDGTSRKAHDHGAVPQVEHRPERGWSERGSGRNDHGSVP